MIGRETAWLTVDLSRTQDKPNRNVTYLDTWKAMEKVYKTHSDKVKAIGERSSTPAALRSAADSFLRLPGVSNFSVEFLKNLLEAAEVVPAVNQIELHP